jgi:hypothetical protein
MNIVILMAFFVLAAAIVWLWPRRARRVKNPKPHHRADEFHYWFPIDGKPHAFSIEQLIEAEKRAARLSPALRSKRLAWWANVVKWLGVVAIAIIAAGLLVAVLSGCRYIPSSPRRVVEAQKPGIATGAGATFTGPTNSAAPSTQTAEKRVAYYPRPQREPLPRYYAPVVSPGSEPAPSIVEQNEDPTIAWMYERAETTFGEHQNAGAIMKAAAAMSKWSSLRWIGLTCVVLGVLGMAWSYKNEESGYPLVYLKLAGFGVFFLLASDNPLWLLLLIIPVGFYAVQKFGLWKLP